ncbi:GNAT family N-acetyltransferase [Motiliproteus sp. MSK22-1]|uniref:GNAT family N-acetyltransferase n=1 Tax=Motiliproteus sp. MSK22-1 TaxID=1897630 RepID=UPI000975DDBA|nr:GNAT family N-acetyltransferase [Motiliproteus sp. MSK22-1]OMH25290.1 hypothetical protein BGP75_26180 [Motiliproteus sp. MSK22-1]
MGQGSIDISFERLGNTGFSFAEEIVRENMAVYYQQHELGFNRQQFRQFLSEYESYILKTGNNEIGIICLSFEADVAYIRDIQLLPEYQSKGIGSWVIKQFETTLLRRNYRALRLRVFASNPAYQLYQRLGFAEKRNDGATIGMEKILSAPRDQ